MKKTIITVLLAAFMTTALAENGSGLWLRMSRNTNKVAVQSPKSATLKIASEELATYLHDQRNVILTRVKSSALDDGYTISFTAKDITLSSSNDVGILYAAYALLRQQETDQLPQSGTITSRPEYQLRVLNHWDNPNGTVERGYSGSSIFWPADTASIKFGTAAYLQRLRDYARANASVGINVTVLNNVNAKPLMLTKDMIRKVKVIADQLRPYGMKVMIAVNFASPKALGDLKTADPLDKDVVKWWHNKSKEIYKLIPDFAGYLVKANSEGEPGPMDYNRTHVDGANMLADALTDAWTSKNQPSTFNIQLSTPIVMWRAFVYSSTGGDRASQAYNEFMPYDGQFRDNVIIQIKNGPIDFQPREPISPLFFGLKKTRMMPEFQITQEYTGESIHTCFLAPMWNEFFATLSAYQQPTANTQQPTALAGVANIGDYADWCGSVMTQSNWYAFGRLAWDSHLSSESIAREWVRQTFDIPHDNTETPLVRLLCDSREAVVRYMMPLGLHHIFAAGHHYGPEPWCDPKGWREDWKPVFYHKADSQGVGFNRSMTGSKNVEQYPEPLASEYNDINTCPEQLLLWFHHAPWNHRMHSGETLWEALCHSYDLGVREAAQYPVIWQQLKKYVDSERFDSQLRLFDRQAKDASWWRDACLLYFQQFSCQPFPLDCPAPRHSLDALKAFTLDMDNYTRADISKLP